MVPWSRVGADLRLWNEANPRRHGGQHVGIKMSSEIQLGVEDSTRLIRLFTSLRPCCDLTSGQVHSRKSEINSLDKTTKLEPLLEVRREECIGEWSQTKSNVFTYTWSTCASHGARHIKSFSIKIKDCPHKPLSIFRPPECACFSTHARAARGLARVEMLSQRAPQVAVAQKSRI